MIATKPVGAMVKILNKYPEGQMWFNETLQPPTLLDEPFALIRKGFDQWELKPDGERITLTEPNIWKKHTAFGTGCYTYFIDGQALHNKW